MKEGLKGVSQGVAVFFWRRKRPEGSGPNSKAPAGFGGNVPPTRASESLTMGKIELDPAFVKSETENSSSGASVSEERLPGAETARPSRGAFEYRRFIKWAGMREGPQAGATRFNLAEQRSLLNQLRGGEGKRPVALRTFKRWRAEAIEYDLVETYGRTDKRPDRRQYPAKRGAYTRALPSVTYLDEYKRDRAKSGTFNPIAIENDGKRHRPEKNGTFEPSKMALSSHTKRSKNRDPKENSESTVLDSFPVPKERARPLFNPETYETVKALEREAESYGFDLPPGAGRFFAVRDALKRVTPGTLLERFHVAATDPWVICETETNPGFDIVRHVANNVGQYAARHGPPVSMHPEILAEALVGTR